MSILNVSQIQRLREIAYLHKPISSNPFMYSNKNIKCFDRPSKDQFTCIKKWDNIYSMFS